MQRKKLLYLFIGISLFTAAYLYYVDVERKQSIEKYFGQPKVGDIYKIKGDFEGNDQWICYLKLVEVKGDSRVFYQSKMMANGSVDYILNHYYTDTPIEYSAQELKDLKEGKWNNYLKENTTLVEIVRRR